MKYFTILIFFYYTFLLADNYVWRIATFAPDKSPLMVSMKKLATSLEEKSKGQLILHFYPGGVAGTDQEVLDKMKKGILQGAIITSAGLGEIIPEIRVMETPFAFSSYEEYDSRLEALSDNFKTKLLENGYALLGWTDQGFVYLMSSQKIDSTESMAQTHSWVWEGDPMALALAKSFSSSFLPLKPDQVLMSLQKGTIDTVYMTPLAILFFQWYSHVQYFLDMPVANAIGGMVVSKSEYDKLPRNLQKLLKEKSFYFTKQMVENIRNLNEKAILVLKKKKIQFITPSKERKEQFKAKGIQAAKSLAGKLYSWELLQKVISGE